MSGAGCYSGRIRTVSRSIRILKRIARRAGPFERRTSGGMGNLLGEIYASTDGDPGIGVISRGVDRSSDRQTVSVSLDCR